MTDYKNYSLEQLKNFLYDAMGAAEASPQEIYDVIKGVVEDNYYTYKHQTSQAYELLALLNGNGVGHVNATEVKDKVKKWVLPVEVSDDLEDYVVTFPDDLLEAANLKEGDLLDWVDNGDGSYLLKKFERKTNTYDEMVAAGYTMTDDGFWILTSEGC